MNLCNTGTMQLKKNDRNTLQPLCLSCRASGSLKRPDADTVKNISILISPSWQKWHFKPNCFLQQRDEPFGHKEHDTHTHAGKHMHAKTCAHTLTSFICPPWSYVSIIHCLRDLLCSHSERFATAGECRTDAEHANNLLKSFYSSSLSADRFRTAPLGPDEWTCLTE